MATAFTSEIIGLLLGARWANLTANAFVVPLARGIAVLVACQICPNGAGAALESLATGDGVAP
jgi:hypothetical protein